VTICSDEEHVKWLVILESFDDYGRRVQVGHFYEKPNLKEYEDTQKFTTIKLFGRDGNKWVKEASWTKKF